MDYQREDFTHTGKRYDIIFDAVGKSSYPSFRAALNDQGVYLTTNMSLGILWHMLVTSKSTGKKARFSATGLRSNEDKLKDLRIVKGLIEEDKLKAVIDRSYDMEAIVEDCRYVDQGHKKGNVVMRIAGDLEQ